MVIELLIYLMIIVQAGHGFKKVFENFEIRCFYYSIWKYNLSLTVKIYIIST